MDEYCDPEPLLELCRMVLKQNPKSLFYRVFEGYALALLGRRREAEDSAHMAAEQPRLWKNPPLLAVWLPQLPPEDPERERGELAMERLVRRLSPQTRAVLARAGTMRARAAQIQEARPELEPLLLADLEQAGCTREQVAAHMALGIYYQRRGLENKAQEHLSFVVARGGRLAVRTEAERMLCRLSGKG